MSAEAIVKRLVRTAEEQFKAAGFETMLVSIAQGYCYLGGKGGEVMMSAEEWEKYRALCHEELARDVGLALVKVREVEQIVHGALATLNEEDREDSLKVVRGRLGQVREMVLRVAERLKCGVMELVRPSKGKGGEAV